MIFEHPCVPVGFVQGGCQYKDEIDAISILRALRFSAEGLFFLVGPHLLGYSFFLLLVWIIDVMPSTSVVTL